jgi:hypothetical protein
VKNWLGACFLLITLACGIRRDNDDKKLFVGDVNCIIGINPLQFFDKADPDWLLTLPLVRVLLESSSFDLLFTQLFENPIQAGINFRQPFYLINTQWDSARFWYVTWHVTSEAKMEAFFQSNGYQNLRIYKDCKVIVSEPFAIAWNNSFCMIAPSLYLPDMLESITAPNSTSDSGECYLQKTDPDALISFLVRPDFLPIWHENIDRLHSCGLQISEIKNQFIVGEFFERNDVLSIDVRFQYQNSWNYFWRIFFNQNNQLIEKIDTTSPKGSIFTSRFDLQKTDSILYTNCPVNLLETYFSIPSQKIMQRALSCLEENYAFYLPYGEPYPENHLTLFKVRYPDYLHHILEEELSICLGSNDILSDSSYILQSSPMVYYAIRDSMLIVSKNALNIVKSEDTFNDLQKLWQKEPFSYGAFYILPSHLKILLGINNLDQIEFNSSNLRGNIMENRLRIQLMKAKGDPNGLSTFLHIVNDLYMYNKSFFEYWEKPYLDVEL